MKLLTFLIYLVPTVIHLNQVKAQENLEKCSSGFHECADDFGSWCCDDRVECCNRSCCDGDAPWVLCCQSQYTKFQICCTMAVYKTFTAAVQNSLQNCQAMNIPNEKCCGGQQCPDEQLCCENPFQPGEEFRCCSQKEFDELRSALYNKVETVEQFKV